MILILFPKTMVNSNFKKGLRSGFSVCHSVTHELLFLCLQLMFLAYLFFLVWLGVTAFTSLPVFMYFNVWTMCQNTSLVEAANLCLDLRQFGMCHDNMNCCWWMGGRRCVDYVACLSDNKDIHAQYAYVSY